MHVNVKVKAKVNLEMDMDMDCGPTIWKGEGELQELNDDDGTRVIDAMLQCFLRQYCREGSGRAYSEENMNKRNLT
jgi:hypothetical protein